ncbi:hypothetical protein SDC9_110214 [bioreactor metagenome]|uniref:Uncharacterized protein n=1 Tax=bioreactor metagenome TaxID=1076179 RepID=A0A645BNG7_9ZZZZ
MVAHVLQLPQVVGGHQHRGAALRNVLHQQRPHLAAHHRVQSVHRFVQHQQVRPAAQGKPEGRLLLHALGQPADGPLFVHGGEHVLERPVPGGVEPGEEAPVKAHHILG